MLSTVSSSCFVTHSNTIRAGPHIEKQRKSGPFLSSHVGHRWRGKIKVGEKQAEKVDADEQRLLFEAGFCERTMLHITFVTLSHCKILLKIGQIPNTSTICTSYQAFWVITIRFWVIKRASPINVPSHIIHPCLSVMITSKYFTEVGDSVAKFA
ncbi:hypothetical protein DM02DRAFT_378433 [Periconia macrospinosa]|uniref:Uncharacterized protein n=1 Tax=Periconia macrospinosa TaxID=97972 RepID=A0A2V1EC08_9PLEO|nr:hypothetical protein DM02DRAFT_378433 [Periconia macrospinosa]